MIAVATARRALRPSLVRVDLGAALNLVGAILKYLGVTFLLATAIALGYGEPAWPFLASGAATSASGWALERLTQGKEQIGPREGFFVVSFTWLAGAFFVSLPYVLADEPQLANPLDAYFEAMSGMMTTGASVLTDVPALDRSLAMWRQFSQWVGGMGIIVLALAVLPRLRVGGRQLFESEAPGPEAEQLATSMRETARRLWLLYVALIALVVAVLTALAWTGVDRTMSFYDAVAHAFSTLPTGASRPALARSRSSGPRRSGRSPSSWSWPAPTSRSCSALSPAGAVARSPATRSSASTSAYSSSPPSSSS